MIFNCICPENIGDDVLTLEGIHHTRSGLCCCWHCRAALWRGILSQVNACA